VIFMKATQGYIPFSRWLANTLPQQQMQQHMW
jgi:hypothetical protein